MAENLEFILRILPGPFNVSTAQVFAHFQLTNDLNATLFFNTNPHASFTVYK